MFGRFVGAFVLSSYRRLLHLHLFPQIVFLSNDLGFRLIPLSPPKEGQQFLVRSLDLRLVPVKAKESTWQRFPVSLITG